MKKKLYLILLILIVIISITMITAIYTPQDDNHIIENIEKVTDSDDNEPKDRYEVETINVHGYKELKHEIETHSSKENKSYIFNLEDGDYNITSTIKCGLSPSDSQYTINGNGHVIDGNGKKQFIELFANLKVKDLTVQNTIPVDGNSSSVITMETVSELYIKNSSFINSYGKTKGSTITNRGTCYIIGCKFLNNSVDDVGGAIWSNGQYGGNLTIKNSLFENNTANLQKNNDRTSIIYMVSYGNNTIENNQFINNTGRCIHSFNQTNTNIINNKFIDNVMKENEVIRGGLIDNYEADIHIKNNEFVNDNTTGELRGGILYHEIGEMEFCDNKVENYNINPDAISVSTCSKGGVIFNRNATSTINNNEFNNVMVANYSRGGVIYNNLGNISLDGNRFNNIMDGNHLRGLIVFNDVNSVLNVGKNSYEANNTGSIEASSDEEKLFYNSDVKNSEGHGTKGIVNHI